MPSTLGTDIVANRGDYDRIIGMNGDSLTRGFAVDDTFADELDPGHPLYNFRSPESIANWALDLNGITDRFAWLGNFHPTNSIATHIAAGVYLPGDLCLCEDAAAPPSPYDTTIGYYRLWRNARFDAVLAGVDFVGMTMFDYTVGAMSLGANTANQMDFKRDTGELKTYNDSIRAACAAPVPSGSGATTLIDMNDIMDRFRSLTKYVYNVEVMGNDGVHMEVTAQLCYVGALLEYADLRRYVVDIDAIQDVAETNYAALGLASGADARLLVEYALRHHPA